MNKKRYFSAAIVLFVFIFFYEWLIHGVLLSGEYAKTPTIWRDMSDMMAKMPFNILIQALIALWFTFIFTKLFPKGGSKSGIQLGFFFGILSGIQVAGTYYWLPISFELALLWFFANLLESILGGWLVGTVYKK